MIDYNKQALKFLYRVMQGKTNDIKIITTKRTIKNKDRECDDITEQFEAQSIEIKPELTTRMKAAEILLKYNIEIEKQYTDNNAKGNGIMILPAADIQQNQ